MKKELWHSAETHNLCVTTVYVIFRQMETTQLLALHCFQNSKEIPAVSLDYLHVVKGLFAMALLEGVKVAFLEILVPVLLSPVPIGYFALLLTIIVELCWIVLAKTENQW